MVTGIALFNFHFKYFAQLYLYVILSIGICNKICIRVHKIIARSSISFMCHTHDLVASRSISKGTCLPLYIFSMRNFTKRLGDFSRLDSHKSKHLFNNVCFSVLTSRAYVLDAVLNILFFFVVTSIYLHFGCKCWKFEKRFVKRIICNLFKAAYFHVY